MMMKEMVLDRFSLQGKVIVITGAAGYLGEMHTRAVIEAGGIPILIDHEEGKLADLVAHLRSEYGTDRIHGFAVSVTDAVALEAVLRDTDARYNRLDGLINNACYNPTMKDVTIGSGRLESLDVVQWERELDVGLYGALCCSQIFGAYLASHGGGVLLNIASDLGVIAPNQTLYEVDGLSENQQPKKPVTYSVIKWGLIGLTKYLSTYWADKGVRANAVALGGVFNHQKPFFLEKVEKLIPMGRMANRDEYMGSIVYLLSEASSYMTGAVVPIDGGRTAW